MDPASRRTVWSVMSSSKPGRAIVLTTHFLDEADALGDRVAMQGSHPSLLPLDVLVHSSHVACAHSLYGPGGHTS